MIMAHFEYQINLAHGWFATRYHIPRHHISLSYIKSHIALFNRIEKNMMTSSKINIFRVNFPLWGEPPVTGGFPSQKPVTRSFDVFFNLCLNKRLSKQWRHGYLRRHRAHYDGFVMTHWYQQSATVTRSCCLAQLPEIPLSNKWPNWFCRVKFMIFWFKFHWNLFLRLK